VPLGRFHPTLVPQTLWTLKSRQNVNAHRSNNASCLKLVRRETICSRSISVRSDCCWEWRHGEAQATVATAIRERHGHIPVVLLTGYPKELPKELLEIVDASVTKGQNPDVLLGEMRRLTAGPKKPPAPEIVAKAVDYLKKKRSPHQ
jgi:hypothetical protein